MKEQATDLIFKAEISKEVEQQQVESVWNEENAQATHQEASSAFNGASGGGSAEMNKQSEHGGEQLKAVDPIRRKDREPGPNDPCPCGSGKKYKKCHGRIGGDGLAGATAPLQPKPSRGGGREYKGEEKMGG
jgi:preprotein translocase subunit SecA